MCDVALWRYEDSNSDCWHFLKARITSETLFFPPASAQPAAAPLPSLSWT